MSALGHHTRSATTPPSTPPPTQPQLHPDPGLAEPGPGTPPWPVNPRTQIPGRRPKCVQPANSTASLTPEPYPRAFRRTAAQESSAGMAANLHRPKVRCANRVSAP